MTNFGGWDNGLEDDHVYCDNSVQVFCFFCENETELYQMNSYCFYTYSLSKYLKCY